MSTETNRPEPEFLLTPADIRRAADEGVLAHGDAKRLIDWGYDQRFDRTLLREPAPEPAPETRKGLNAVTVAYYFGAMLMISACAWFLGDKWEALGTRGVFVTVLVYMLAALGLGLGLRRRGYVVGGGLLVTVAVCLVPLLVYTVEDMLGLWPGPRPGEYAAYYPRVHGSWIVMELATMLAALVALRYVPFGFLTAPLAHAFWFFSMDVAEWAFGQELSRDTRCWVSVLVGLLTILVGYGLERSYRRREVPRTDDFAFWCYLFGLLAFWGGFTFMESGSEVGRLLYALLNVGLIAVGVYLRRSVFIVFGVLGVHVYLGHLAYEVFKDSVLFPFALALLGLSVILVTVLAQRQFIKRLKRQDA
ncbi:MAG: DUF2157 domain-containing protein [Acidobacteria bacterium]|nr:DUF2157 domain-containing protein [Acidobacteriota bacterium]